MSVESAESQVVALPIEKVQQANQGLSIGKGVRINGDLSSRKDVLINGRVSGTIALKQNKLEIGESGHVEANIFAKIIIVSGKIMGDLMASEQIMITKTGQVIGDIYAPDVSIEDGAHVKGNIDMQKQDIFKVNAVQPVLEDNRTKNFGFGFLFKKAQKVPEEMLLPDLRENEEVTEVAEELASLTHDDVHPLSGECSILNETVVIKGEIISEEDVIIQGHVDGLIYFKNCSVGIGPHAEIKGDIFAKTIVHHGRSTGNIYASDQVSIKKPAFVSGKIFAPRVSTETGSMLMGGIEMAEQNIEELYAALHEPAVVIEQPTLQEVKDTGGDVGGSSVQQSASGKAAWPIFYPRG